MFYVSYATFRFVNVFVIARETISKLFTVFSGDDYAAIWSATASYPKYWVNYQIGVENLLQEPGSGDFSDVVEEVIISMAVQLQ